MTVLDDDEIRDLTLWETEAEIPAFRAGWLARRFGTYGCGEVPDAKALGLYPSNQNARVGWQRGWMACDAVRKVLLHDEQPNR